MVIFKNYKKYGSKVVTAYHLKLCVLIKKSMLLIQKLKNFKITPQSLLIN